MKKMKLKKLRQLVADLKNAWLEARKDGTAEEECEKARKEYLVKYTLLEGYDADGKKDTDTVDVPEVEAEDGDGDGDGKGADGKSGDDDAGKKKVPGEGDDAGNVIELKDLQKHIAKTVGDALKSELEEYDMDEQIQESVQKAVFEALKEKAPENMKDQITEEKLKAVVLKVFKDAKLEGKKITAEQLKQLVTESCNEAVKGLKTKSKMQHNTDDATGKNGGVEFGGYSLRKGNLPLHMKQLTNVLLGKDRCEGIDQVELQKGKDLADDLWRKMSVMGAKALTTSEVGAGAEWMPRDLSSELYRRMYLESNLAQAFMATEVDMPTDPFDYPLLTVDPEFKLNNVENTEPDASDPGTGKITLRTSKLMALVQMSYEANEDSILPMLPTFEFMLARAAARALEDAIINGDTATPHMDSDVTAANDRRKAWLGLRAMAIDASLTSDFSTGGLNRANLLALLKMLGKWGVNSRDLLWIAGSGGWTSLLGLDEVALANQRGGVGSFIAGGPPPAPWGGRIIVSEMVRENLNASGVYDGSTTTKGSILVANMMAFILGSRRDFMIEVDRNIKSQTHTIVASFRKAFQPVELPSATIKTVALGRNYDS